MQGAKAQEIANKLNISLGSVKMCISRLKKKSGFVELKKQPNKLQESIRKDFKDVINELNLPDLTKDFLIKKQNNIAFLTLCITERVVNYLNNIDIIESREERETVALKIKMLQVMNTMFTSNNNNN